jgi:hypothetical protein
VQLQIHLFEFAAIQLWQFRNDFLRAHIVKMPCLTEVVNFCALTEIQICGESVTLALS